LSERRTFITPGLFWFWHDAVEACVLTDHLDEAQELLSWLEAVAAPLDHAPSRAAAELGRALVAAAQGDAEAAIRASDAALAQHERFERPLHLARTLLIRGAILRRAKKRRAAPESLASARDIFERSGARLWLARTHRELERTGHHHAAGWELTPTEADVARLAVAGARNKEIAEQLFMSFKTVEANLPRIYGKLGVRSRTELAAKLR
jgi:DNA-binding NarL/FixJ family response regulator